MKNKKIIICGALLTSLFAVSAISSNVNSANIVKATEESHSLRNEFVPVADGIAWGTPWGVEVLNTVEFLRAGQGVNLADASGKLPSMDTAGEYVAPGLSIATYPAYHNAGMTEANGYYNQYPEGWKMDSREDYATRTAWPAATGKCTACTKYLKFYYAYSNTQAAFHPGLNCAVVVYYTAPKAGNITLHDDLSAPNSVDGTYFTIYKINKDDFVTSRSWNSQSCHGLFGGNPIYPNKGQNVTTDWNTWAKVDPAKGYSYTTDAFSVEQGDVIAWVFDSGASNASDATTFNPTVTYLDYDLITVSKSSTSLFTGDDETITAEIVNSISGSSTVTWTSSNESVATIVDGKITAIAPGTASIKATLTGGTAKSGETEVSAICTVTVIDPVESISIKNQPSKLIYSEDEYFDPSGLVITVKYTTEEPDLDVTYSEENKNDFTFSPSLTTKLARGTNKVSITYAEKTVDQAIIVNDKSEYTLRNDFERTADKSGFNGVETGTSEWAVESINTVEFTRAGQGVNLADENGKLPAFITEESLGKYQAPNLSLGTYPMWNSDKLIEYGNKYYNQYPFGWKMTNSSEPNNTAAWPADTGNCTADNSSIRFYFEYTDEKVAFHPGTNCGIVVYFVAPRSGNITLHDEMSISDNNSDGTYLTIYKIAKDEFVSDRHWNGLLVHGLYNAEPIYPNKGQNVTSDWSTWKKVDQNNGLTYTTNAITVNQGDVIAWVLGPGATNGYDTTVFNPTVDYVDYDVLSLDKNELTVCNGSTAELKASVSPEDSASKGIIWTSSDESVATVNESGVVTGIKPGTATIKATLTDGKVEDGKAEVSDTCTVTVSGADSIKVSHMPNKVEYSLGDTFDYEGLIIEATYSDGHTSNPTDFEVSSPDMMTAGTKEVTVTYEGKEATFEITVILQGLESITIDTENVKKEFEYLEEFTYEGLTVTAHKDDSATFNVDLANCTIEGYDKSVVGEQTITVTYGGRSATYNVTVNKSTVVESIAVKTNPPKVAYYVGDTFVEDGLVIEATFTDSHKESVTNFTLSDIDMSTAGEKEITANYEGKTASFTITVSEIELEYIDVDLTSAKTVYAYGEEFTSDNIVIQGHNNNGSVFNINKDDCTFSGFSKKVSGEQTITVKYGEQTTTFNVTVNQSEVIHSIYVKTMPNQVNYVTDDTFDDDGLVIEAIFTDGHKEEITGYGETQPDMSTSGRKTITVTYEDKTTSFNILVSVKPTPVLTEVEIVDNLTKVEYTVGESFDASGLVLKATFNDGTTKSPIEFSVDAPEKFETPGTKTINISVEVYGVTKTTSVTVNVKAASVDGCGGSIVAASAMISGLSLLGLSLLIAKKKHE